MAHPPVDQEVFWSVNWDDFEWVFHGRTVGEASSPPQVGEYPLELRIPRRTWTFFCSQRWNLQNELWKQEKCGFHQQ